MSIIAKNTQIQGVLPMGFRPGQVDYRFNVTKEMTVECSWGERLIPNFFSSVPGQSLKSRSEQVSMQQAGLCLWAPLPHSHSLGLCP